MKRTLPIASLLAFSLPVPLAAQMMGDQDAMDQMKYDIQYLASDRLEGREAGTPGERLADVYVVQKFSSIGLMPYGDSATYDQPFHFAGQPTLGAKNALQIGRRKQKIDEEWYPLTWSSNGQVLGKTIKCGYGIQAPDLDYDDYAGKDPKGKCVALSVSSPDGIHPHSKYLAYNDLEDRVHKAMELGAVAVVLYNDDPDAEDPSAELSPKMQPIGVPVVFLKGDRYKTLLPDNNPCAIGVDIDRPEMTAHNLAGMLDNGKDGVVVIGAHLDHLGYGGEGSLWRGGPAIHNGADDNASGVAAMLQLARDLTEMDEARANDYLFIAFSGEEKGLYGSNYWTKHPTVPLDRINYMINLDMVGRMDSTRDLEINGVGTSPAWAEVDGLTAGDLKIKTSEGGIGPSDHTSFYLKDIPVLHFFTGAHEDYHKPSDDEEKINYPGLLSVVRYIEAAITTLNDNGKLAFTRTQDADTSKTPRFTVTLGVVPDYMFDGRGMRIDGVTDGKPASHAGLKPGDVVIKLGDAEVIDMMSYMKGLSMFKKGDATKVTVLRDGKEMQADIQF